MELLPPKVTLYSTSIPLLVTLTCLIFTILVIPFRFTDVSPGIRVECVRYSKYFLVYHPHLTEDATMRLHERFYDREERVRLEVVKAVCETAADNFDAVPKQVDFIV